MNLRVSYALPENLMSHVGPVGVWGDVNDILQENLILMKVRWLLKSSAFYDVERQLHSTLLDLLTTRFQEP